MIGANLFLSQVCAYLPDFRNGSNAEVPNEGNHVSVSSASRRRALATARRFSAASGLRRSRLVAPGRR
jgi:hypothetical protein